MSKILEDNIDENYCKKYLLTAIMPDGSIIAIEKGKKDGFHKEAFEDLIKEIENELKIKTTLEPKEGLYNNLQEFINNNIIPISTLYIQQQPYNLASDVQVLKFPKKMKIQQLSSMRKLLVIFKQIGCVYFNEQGKDDSEEHNGLEELEEYIDNRIKELEEVYDR